MRQLLLRVATRRRLTLIQAEVEHAERYDASVTCTIALVSPRPSAGEAQRSGTAAVQIEEELTSVIGGCIDPEFRVRSGGNEVGAAAIRGTAGIPPTPDRRGRNSIANNCSQ